MTLPGEFFNVHLGVPHPSHRTTTIQKIKQQFFEGRFIGPTGDAIVELLQIVGDDDERRDELKLLHQKSAQLIAQNDQLRNNFPGPECGDCGCQMDLGESKEFYECSHCWDNRCICFQSAPCSWCMHLIPADVHMFEDASMGRQEILDKKKMVAASFKEAGPSAVETAKPVTPSLIVSSQGDWWDGMENL